MQWCLGLVVVYGMDPWVGQSLDGPSFYLSSELCNSFHASAWQIQKWMLTVIYKMEHRAPNGEAREST